jgi:hypothetical protein
MVAAISVFAGAFAALADASPTGGATVDVVLTALVVGAVTWLGAAALRWDAAVLAFAAAATSWNPLGAALGVATAVVGYSIPVPRPYRSAVTAAMVAIALNVAVRSQLGGFLGLSAIVFAVLATAIGVVGARRRSRTVRRAALVAVVGAGALSVLAATSLGVFGALAAGDVRNANGDARSGLRALGDGDITAARAAFTQAAIGFERAGERVDNPATAIAGLVPGLSQHRRVATELTAAGAGASDALAAELGEIDLDALSVSGGRIDVDAVRAVQQSLLTVDREITQLQRTIDGVDSPWLVPPVADQIDRLAGDVAEQRQRSDDALSVALAAPALLGADEPRTYFIGFTTPSEARGIGGFMGNWAEITVTDGHIELTGFGRHDDLQEAGDPTTRRFTTSDTAPDGGDPGLDEWLARYGPYNIDSGPGGTTGPAVWKNINMSPDMATTGRAIADLYPQSGGAELDGVFIMDVYTLARFLEFTGPIELPDGQVVDGQRSVTTDTAADFLLNDQYDVTRTAERVDILEEFSTTVIDRLLATTLPPPTDLLDTLGPMVDQGRFTGWAARASEQELLDRIGMSGTLAPLGIDLDSDALAVVFNNAAGSKIDYYLDASSSYTVTADATTGSATAELVVELTNTAPTTGEPNYVIGNGIGLPIGSNRTWVSIFSRLPVLDVRLDDRPAAVEFGVEAGYHVTSAFVTLASGDSATLTVSMGGRLDIADGYHLAVRTPPAVAPMPLRVEATWIDGEGVAHGTVDQRRDPGLARITVGAER